MNLFCLLCIPLVYFLRRAVSNEKERNSIWALPLGGVMVILQYFTGPLLTPEGFGFFRWMSGFVDIISLPVIVSLLVFFALIRLKIFSVEGGGLDYAGFALLWMVPPAAIRSIIENSPSPITLVLIPLLWIAQAVGIPFFINCIAEKPRWYVTVPAVLGIVALPIAAASSWWAYFSQRSLLGFLFLVAALTPAVVSIAILFHKDWEREERAESTNEHE